MLRRARKVFVHGAGRCGECHEKMYDEWETSAHAKAATSPLYKAAVADAKDRDVRSLPRAARRATAATTSSRAKA